MDKALRLALIQVVLNSRLTIDEQYDTIIDITSAVYDEQSELSFYQGLLKTVPNEQEYTNG